ncbi:MAG TPA: diguanylate cyclase [Candidatus Dormibacteraeota bacterium]|jgi:diguanylate cyclase (GGDEF)-like protein/putative nucleotidyltransferase with HDIG domain|nr:diguanylate cyclase [Candidatus Dormibacteraeota bacterium]
MLLRIVRDLTARFESGRLSTKILILSVLTTMVPLMFLTVLFDRANTNNGRELLRTTLKQQSAEQVAEIEGRMVGWRRAAVQLSSDPRLAAALGARRVDGDAMSTLNRGLMLDPDFRAIALVDNSGQVLGSTDPAAYTNATLAPARLQFLAPPGATGVSDPVAGQGLPATSVVYAPVGDGTGRLVIAADASSMEGFSNPTRLGPDRFGMLIDGNGVVIGYNGPRPDKVLYHTLGEADPATLTQLKLTGAYGAEPLDPLGMTELSTQLAASPSQGVGQFQFPVIGRAAEVGYSRLSDRPWRVAVMQDEVAFLAPLHASTFTTVLYFLAAAVPIGLLLYMVVRFLERTERQSLHDDLTGLPNRRFFHDLLEREFRRAERARKPLSIINLDLDRFKAINDEHGHAVGDEVLKAFAGLLSRHVRSIDLPVRYGGEEFVVLLPDTDKAGATEAAEKVRRAVEELRLGRRAAGSELRRGISGGLTVSAGVASYPEDGSSPDLVLQRADQAMYLAKSLGRNRAIAFGSAEPLRHLVEDFERLDAVVHNANRATVEALSAAIDARDPYTAGHSRRVAEYAAMIAHEMELTTSEIEALTLGALLHDVGRIASSDLVVRKSTPLTTDERRQLEAHTSVGFRMVSGVPFLAPVATTILHHHENFDGSGYPDGIAGEQIPLAARIIKVADAFDAMTTARMHREARPIEWSLGELRRFSGTHFDPAVVKALVSVDSRQRLRPVLARAAAAS